MSHDNFDDHIRQSLNDYNSDVDAEALWEAVKPKRSRKIAIWWWVSGVLLASIGAATWYGGWPTTSQASNQSTDDTPAVTSIPATATPDSCYYVLPPAQTTGTTAALPAPTPAAGQPKLASTTTGYAHATNAGVNPTAYAPQMAPAQAWVTATAQPVAMAPVAPDQAWVTTATEPIVMAPVTPATATTTSDSSQTYTNTPATSETWPAWLTIPIAGLQPTLALSTQRPLPPPSAPLTRTANTGLNPYQWYLRLSGVGYLPLRTINSLDSLNSWKQQRLDTEKPLEVVGGEFSVGYQLKPRWRLQTGISYTRLNEQFEWTNNTSQVDSIEGVTAIIIDDQGDSTFVNGYIARYQSFRHYKKAYNSYTLLDIPLLAVYEMGTGKLRLNLQAGVYVNLSMKTEGTRMGFDSLFESIDDHADYRTSLGISGLAGLGVSWHISKRLCLEAMTNLRYFPKSFTTDGAPIEQSYQWIGANLGLRYYIR